VRRRSRRKLAILLSILALAAILAASWLFMPRITIAGAFQKPSIGLGDRLSLLLQGRLALTVCLDPEVFFSDSALGSWAASMKGALICDPILSSRLAGLKMDKPDAVMLGMLDSDESGFFDYLLRPDSSSAWKKAAEHFKASDGPVYLLSDSSSEAAAQAIDGVMGSIERKSVGSIALLLEKGATVLCPGAEGLDTLFKAHSEAAWVVEEQDLGLIDPNLATMIVRPSYSRSLRSLKLVHNNQALEITLVYDLRSRAVSLALSGLFG
jgi:hypothetical protein